MSPSTAKEGHGTYTHGIYGHTVSQCSEVEAEDLRLSYHPWPHSRFKAHMGDVKLSEIKRKVFLVYDSTFFFKKGSYYYSFGFVD